MINYIGNGGSFMLIISYVISAALEATLSYQLFQSSGEVPWIYILLLVSSLISIAIEFSNAGEEVRKAMKQAGKSIDQFDIMSNWARSGIYIAVWAGYMHAGTGAILACGCIGIAMLLAAFRFKI